MTAKSWLSQFITPGRTVGAIPLLCAAIPFLGYQAIHIFWIINWPEAGDVLDWQTVATFCLTCALIGIGVRELFGVERKAVDLHGEGFGDALKGLPEPQKPVPQPQPPAPAPVPPQPKPEPLPPPEPAPKPDPEEIPEHKLPPIPAVNTTRNPTIDILRPEYEALYANCIVRPEKEGELSWLLGQLAKHQHRYQAVSDQFQSMPWEFVAAIAQREMGIRFDRHLHNGDPLTARTVRVPAGRPETGNPPFTFEESAYDVLSVGSHDMRGVTDWSIPNMLFLLEQYNGWGYRWKGRRSGYLWDASNLEQQGRYVADHVFDPSAWSKQIGCATMFRALGME